MEASPPLQLGCVYRSLWQPRGEGGPEHYQKKGFHCPRMLLPSPHITIAEPWHVARVPQIADGFTPGHEHQGDPAVGQELAQASALGSVLALRFPSARFRSLRQQPFGEIEPLLRLDHLAPKCLHLLIQRLEMGSGVRVPGDAALGYNLRDLDCARRSNGGDDDADDGGEKNCGSMLPRCASYGWPIGFCFYTGNA